MPDEDRNHLRDWRIHRGITQEKLAEEVGTTKAVISLLETEKRPLSSKWLRKLANALETTPGRILDVDPNDPGAEGQPKRYLAPLFREAAAPDKPSGQSKRGRGEEGGRWAAPPSPSPIF